MRSPKIMLNEEPYPVKERPVIKHRENKVGVKFFYIFLLSTFSIAGVLAFANKGIEKLVYFNDRWYFEYHPLVVELPHYTKEEKTDNFLNPMIIGEKERVKIYGEKPEVKTLSFEEKQKLVNETGYAKIINGIWILETNKGENKDKTAHHTECTEAGLSNEFGFGALNNYCFESFEQSVAVVTKWIEKELKSKTLNETLCYYNTGKADSTCGYVLQYNNLDKDGKLALN